MVNNLGSIKETEQNKQTINETNDSSKQMNGNDDKIEFSEKPSDENDSEPHTTVSEETTTIMPEKVENNQRNHHHDHNGKSINNEHSTVSPVTTHSIIDGNSNENDVDEKKLHLEKLRHQKELAEQKLKKAMEQLQMMKKSAGDLSPIENSMEEELPKPTAKTPLNMDRFTRSKPKW